MDQQTSKEYKLYSPVEQTLSRLDSQNGKKILPRGIEIHVGLCYTYIGFGCTGIYRKVPLLKEYA